MLTPENVTRHDLIGLGIKIVKSSNKALVGKRGKIVDESRNTITISKGKSLNKLIKSTITFQTIIGGKKVEVEGKVMIGRPEERLKKR
ncbi:MAG: ribonuclease P protein subunit [Candidatus Woesearchaeota archaeon]